MSEIRIINMLDLEHAIVRGKIIGDVGRIEVYTSLHIHISLVDNGFIFLLTSSIQEAI